MALDTGAPGVARRAVGPAIVGDAARRGRGSGDSARRATAGARSALPTVDAQRAERYRTVADAVVRRRRAIRRLVPIACLHRRASSARNAAHIDVTRNPFRLFMHLSLALFVCAVACYVVAWARVSNVVSL
jgi:hypothetical protein